MQSNPLHRESKTIDHAIANFCGMMEFAVDQFRQNVQQVQTTSPTKSTNVCKPCNGTGWHWQVVGEDDADRDVCDWCEGTGREPI